jgi:hypothetical protein
MSVFEVVDIDFERRLDSGVCLAMGVSTEDSVSCWSRNADGNGWPVCMCDPDCGSGSSMTRSPFSLSSRSLVYSLMFCQFPILLELGVILKLTIILFHPLYTYKFALCLSLLFVA